MQGVSSEILGASGREITPFMEQQRMKGCKGKEMEKGTSKSGRQKKEHVEMEDLKRAAKQPF